MVNTSMVTGDIAPRSVKEQGQKNQWMEAGALGEDAVYVVEEEARLELVQTLHQPMEERIALEILVRSATQMTVGGIQNVLLLEDGGEEKSVFFPLSTRGLSTPAVPGRMIQRTDFGAQLELTNGDNTYRNIGDIVPKSVEDKGLKNQWM